MYEWDVTSGSVSRDPALPALLGFDPATVAPNAEWWIARVHPDDRESIVARELARFDDLSVLWSAIEYRVLHNDGSWRWVADHARLTRDEDGRVTRLVGITADITPKRIAQEALESATSLAATRTAELQSLLDRIGDGYVALDRDWRIVHVNAVAARFNGVTPDDLIGRNGWEVWKSALGTRFETELRAAMADSHPRTFTAFYPRDGSEVGGTLIEDRVFPSAEGISVFFRDVTRDRQGELERRQRLESQELLAAASAVLGRSLDLRATAEAIARAAIPRFADWAVVDALGEDGRLTRLALAHEHPDLLAKALEIDRRWPPDFEREGGVHAVFRSGEPLLLSDLRDEDFAPLARDAEHFAAWRAFRVRSGLTVPLTAGNERIGVLTFLSSESGRRYTEDDLPLALELGERAAAALVNAQRFAREQRAHAEATAARARAEALQAATESLAAAHDVVSVGQIALDVAMRATLAQAGTLARVSADRRWFEQVVGVGLPNESRTAWKRFPTEGAYPAADAIADGFPRYISTRENYLRLYPQLASSLNALGVEASTILPLAQAPGISSAGYLALHFAAPREFAEGERLFLQALARITSQAMDRARLLEAERRERERAQALQSLAALLARVATPEDVALAAVTRGMEATGTIHGVLSLLDADGSTFTIVAAPGVPDDLLRVWHRYPNAGDLPAAVAVRTGAPCYSRTRAEYATRGPDLDLIAERSGIEAEAVLPLQIDGRAIGVISFAFPTARDFDEGEDRFLRAVSDLVASALDRARLYAAERTARAEAEAANRVKGDFLANMSHELRTPLNAIGGHAQLIELGVHGPVTAEQVQALTRVQAASRHLLALINDLLNYARLEAGKVSYDVVAVDLRQILTETLPLIDPQRQTKSIMCDTELPGGRCLVWADSDKLRQILLNLLANAVKFTPERGAITVRVTEPPVPNEFVYIEVSDTGIGIPVDRLESIFEPFVQVRTGRAAEGSGAGLGLTISRDLARGMGGDLTVTSIAGVGSTFRVCLRRALEGERLGAAESIVGGRSVQESV